jgi:hypothetical protein
MVEYTPDRQYSQVEVAEQVQTMMVDVDVEAQVQEDW